MGVNIVSRALTKARLNLGVITPADDKGAYVGFQRVQKWRDDKLETYNKYVRGTQYDNLIDWDQATEQSKNSDHVPIRKRKPRIIFPFAKVLSDRVASKLVGRSNFPQYKVPEDPDSEEFFKAIIRASKLKSRLMDPIKSMNAVGSVFVRFYLEAGSIKIEWYNANQCYPQFFPNGDLKELRVRFVFENRQELDEHGKPVQRWFQLDLGPMSDIIYDNPKYEEGVSPTFEEIARVDHQIGFVQGEWFRTSIRRETPDGYSLIGDILGFIDELNYNLSQSSQAISYNQDPQLFFRGMDEEETQTLIRSATKSWNLGREGEAGFLENDLNGAQVGEEFRTKLRTHIQDVARVVMLDPERVVGHAQSAKAMEVLHGPLVELIDELRPMVEERITALIQKMSLVTLIQASQGLDVPFEIPPGFKPSTLQPEVMWPPIFPQTMEDLRAKVGVATQAASANLVSRETMTRWLAKDFDIEDVEEEIQKIEAQPVINPFGAF